MITPDYQWIEIQPEDGHLQCEKCRQVYPIGESVLTDDYGRLFCHAGCIAGWEQDRAEEANEAQHSGEGPTTASEYRDKAADWLKGRR